MQSTTGMIASCRHAVGKGCFDLNRPRNSQAFMSIDSTNPSHPKNNITRRRSSRRRSSRTRSRRHWRLRRRRRPRTPRRVSPRTTPCWPRRGGRATRRRSGSRRRPSTGAFCAYVAVGRSVGGIGVVIGRSVGRSYRFRLTRHRVHMTKNQARATARQHSPVQRGDGAAADGQRLLRGGAQG